MRGLRRRLLPRALAGAMLLLLLPGIGARPAEAQRPAEVKPWKADLELGGNVFFGNRDQSQLSTRALVERADSLFEASTEFRFSYGESTNRDEIREVNRRNWSAASSLDFRPQSQFRPFVSGRMESAFERQIALRYNAGAGLRMRWERNRENRVDLSVALLAERTYARDDLGGMEDDVGLARWSSNLRVRRGYLNNRLGFDSNTSYQPVFDAFGNYTLSTRNAVSLGVTQVVALRVSLLTEYDSGALDRGAKTNRDGQLEISVAAKF
jgi:hypothetical protein